LAASIKYYIIDLLFWRKGMIDLDFGYWAHLLWVGLAAIAASLILRALYAAFAPPWLSDIGRAREQPARSNGIPLRMSSVVTFLAEFASFLILTRLFPSLGINSFTSGLAVGLLIWLGLVAITVVVNYGFRGARPRLTFIDAGDWLSVFVAQGTIIGALGR
jgi:uncharacterized protein DUF1761